jgi:hypothetical protein
MIFLPTGLVGIGPALRRGWDRVRAPRGDAGRGSSDDRLLDDASPEEV